jgi:hypothetical protein
MCKSSLKTLLMSFFLQLVSIRTNWKQATEELFRVGTLWNSHHFPALVALSRNRNIRTIEWGRTMTSLFWYPVYSWTYARSFWGQPRGHINTLLYATCWSVELGVFEEYGKVGFLPEACRMCKQYPLICLTNLDF